MENHIIATVVSFANEIFFRDSDSDDEENLILEKVDNYAEDTVPYMNDRQFQMPFRMTPATFEILLRKMHFVQNRDTPQRGRPSISLEKEVMILIWCLGNIECFRQIIAFEYVHDFSYFLLFQICSR